MPKYIFTDKQKDDIVNDYLNGMPFENMLQKYGIKTNKPIYRILQEKNISINRNPYILHYSSDMQKEFKKLFKDSLNHNYVEFECSNEYQKHIFDINYFNKIDTQDKAYILGLLYADGNIDRSQRCLSISLQEKDVDILLKIKDILKVKKDLRLIKYSDTNPNWSDQYTFSISNTHFGTTLVGHGLVPNKSLLLEFPTNLPIDLYRHFLRGYNDGDGSITNSKRDKRVRCVSTMNFCNVAKILIETQLKINISIHSCNNNNITSELRIVGGRQVGKFLDWIYEDANLYIKRKYDRYIYLFGNNTIPLSE